MLDSQIVFNLVYCLECEDGNWYVGTTSNLNYRYSQHITGQGSNWTKMHNPLRIHEVTVGGIGVEREKTLEYMRRYGFNRVRGAGWTRCEPLDKDPSIIQT